MSIALVELNEAKARIKASEEREIALIKERVLREIQPKYAELEQIKMEEINNLSSSYKASVNTANEQYNSQLVALQQNFEKRKSDINDAIERRKQDLLKELLQAETYEITKECERAISDLNALIEKRTKE